MCIHLMIAYDAYTPPSCRTSLDSVIQFDAKSYTSYRDGGIYTSKWNVYVLPSNLKIELFGRGLHEIL